jgi:TldD protein
LLAGGDCRRLLAILLSTGADFAEVYCEQAQRTALVLDDADLDAAVEGRDGGVALRLVKGERTFFSNSNNTDLSCLQEAARSLAATLSGKARSAPEHFRHPQASSPSPIEISPAGVAVEQKVEILRRADRAARAMDPSILQVTARYMDTVQHIQVANSLGELATDERVICTLAVQALAREGETIRNGYAASSQTRGFELFDAHPPEETARKATRLALLQLEARPAPAGTFTVVLSSRAGGTMVHEACGHGLEGDFAEKGLSVYTGRLEEEVASPLISVVDDGTLRHGRGSSRIDDEGIPCTRVTLIDRGILKGFLHSRRSARRMETRPTGNGRRESFRHLPIPRMRNTFIAPGETPPEEIVASVPLGVFVAHMGGGEVDIASGNFVFNCSEAYMIRDGRLAEPLRDVTLAGCGPEILRTIDMVGSDLGFEVGTCGKDGQGVPVADAQPTLRIPSILVGGQATDA